MYRLEFATVHSYATERDGITVPVVLKSAETSVRLAASIDTGATYNYNNLGNLLFARQPTQGASAIRVRAQFCHR